MSDQRLAGKRVLIIVENNTVPADRRVWQEALALRDAGADVHVVCPRGLSRDSEEYEVRDGVAIHRFKLTPAQSAVGYVREYATACVRIAALVWHLSRRRSFHVVHACNPPDLLLLTVAPLKLRGVRFIFDHHDLAPELYASRFNRRLPIVDQVLRVCERLSFALADVVLSTNESYRRIALGRGGKDARAVYVVRNAPDESVFRRTAQCPELKQGREHLLAYLGVMAPQDGVDHAVRALVHLREVRSDWHAIFMGDGSALPELRRLARQSGLDNHVEFTGWVEADFFLQVLSTADICLAPEPSSPLNDKSTMIKIAEYMALGVPMVAFDLPESRFTAGESARFVANEDDRAFARQLDELLDDPVGRARMAAAGRSRLATDLSWERSRRALLAAYERALD